MGSPSCEKPQGSVRAGEPKWLNTDVLLAADLREDRPDVAAQFPDALQSLNIRHGADLFHVVEVPLRPGVIDDSGNWFSLTEQKG